MNAQAEKAVVALQRKAEAMLWLGCGGLIFSYAPIRGSNPIAWGFFVVGCVLKSAVYIYRRRVKPL